MENTLSFEEFMEAVKEKAEERTHAHAEVHVVRKNNGLSLMGLIIREDNINISPTIYLDYYYEDYQQKGFDEVFEEIMDAYENNKHTESLDLSFCTDYEKVRDKLRIRLCNYEMNKEQLQDVPHLKYLDLVIVFQIVMESVEYGSATVLIHNHFLDMWGKTTEELYEVAMENMKSECEITSMVSILAGIGLCDCSDEMNGSMYVMTNSLKLFGAATMLLKDRLAEFAKEEDCRYVVILPSSVHEILLLPHHSIENVHELANMVQDVNDTQVERMEILSYNVYVYDNMTNEITIAE